MLESLGQRLRVFAEKDGRGYPDWATRYVPVVRQLQSRVLPQRRIVEIGANANGFARFAGVRVIVVDIELGHLREAREAQDVLPVRADAAHLPFRDDAVELCVCMDTFEHLPEGARRGVTQEIARVLAYDGTAVVGFPSGGASAEAEREIAAAYYAYAGRPLRWLEEHGVHGLPEAGRVAQGFIEATGASHRVTSEQNTPLVVWTWMWRILMCGWPGRGNAFFQALLRIATPVLCRVHFGTCYRSVIWVEPK